jgi:hypothetical protein
MYEIRLWKLGGILYDRTSFMHMENDAMVDTLTLSLKP